MNVKRLVNAWMYNRETDRIELDEYSYRENIENVVIEMDDDKERRCLQFCSVLLMAK